MLTLLSKKLRPNPSFFWRIGRNTSPARHFFSTEPVGSTSEDGGKGILFSLSNDDDKNPTRSSSSVAGAQDTKTLLRRYGFTDTHLSKLHNHRPSLFTSLAAPKTLLPKLEFYHGIGISNTELHRMVCLNPSLLDCSLHNQLVPWYNFIKHLLLLLSSDDSESDAEQGVVKILKRNPRLINCSVDKTIAPNVAALRQAGVPHKQILYLLRTLPTALGSSSLRASIKQAAEMGFDPNKISFADAVKLFAVTSKSTRDKKTEVYRKCGMTDAHILMAFRSFPCCMSLSEQNIEQTMDFVVKKMGWKPVDLARNPTVLGCSLEKRTMPRCTVVRYLQGKGLIRNSISFGTFIPIKEKDFIDKFVKKYKDDVPDLMDIYLGKIIIPPPPQESIL